MPDAAPIPPAIEAAFLAAVHNAGLEVPPERRQRVMQEYVMLRRVLELVHAEDLAGANPQFSVRKTL